MALKEVNSKEVEMTVEEVIALQDLDDAFVLVQKLKRMLKMTS